MYSSRRLRSWGLFSVQVLQNCISCTATFFRQISFRSFFAIFHNPVNTSSLSLVSAAKLSLPLGLIDFALFQNFLEGKPQSGYDLQGSWYSRLEMILGWMNSFSCSIQVQSTPDNLNLQGKSKRVRVIGSSKKIVRSKEKNSFYCIVNISITFNCRNVKWKLKHTSRL